MYSGRKTLPGKKPFMSLEEFRDILNNSGCFEEDLLAEKMVSGIYS
jgi:hypothetical protein